jgi:hypothetical protein
MLTSAMDHLVVTAPTLNAGVRFVEKMLGCTMQPGGQHARMGTHNALLRLSGQCYLEVIAIDPGAAPPGRARWFELDTLQPDDRPRLATWIVRTNDIQRAMEPAEPEFGTVEEMSRGSLNWLISISADGRFPFNGIAPALIQWQSEPHPVTQLATSPISLIQLMGVHPEAFRINAMLHRIGFIGDVSITEPSDGITVRLSAIFQTPRGIVTLS